MISDQSVSVSGPVFLFSLSLPLPHFSPSPPVGPL